MATILYLVSPLPSCINVHTLLAKSLIARGQQVVFAAMKDAQARIEAYGLEYVPLFADRLPKGVMEEWLSGDIARNTLRQKLDFYLGERREIVHHEQFVEYLTAGGFREF